MCNGDWNDDYLTSSRSKHRQQHLEPIFAWLEWLFVCFSSRWLFLCVSPSSALQLSLVPSSHSPSSHSSGDLCLAFSLSLTFPVKPYSQTQIHTVPCTPRWWVVALSNGNNVPSVQALSPLLTPYPIPLSYLLSLRPAFIGSLSSSPGGFSVSILSSVAFSCLMVLS